MTICKQVLHLLVMLTKHTAYTTVVEHNIKTLHSRT